MPKFVYCSQCDDVTCMRDGARGCYKGHGYAIRTITRAEYEAFERAQMPSLAGLSLARRRVPTGWSLSDAPYDAIGLLVHQAVVDARKADDPVRTMCAWMENFCTAYAVKAQGQACLDQWYRVAIEVFGYVAPPVPGQEPALPTNSAFQTWQRLFYALCDAFTAKPPHETRFFWRFFRTWGRVNDHLGTPWPNEWLDRNRILDPTLTPRELEELLDALFKAKVWMDLEANWDEALVRPWTTAHDLIWQRHAANFRQWMSQEPYRFPDPEYSLEYWQTSDDTWMAVATLLMLRGARLWDDTKGMWKYDAYAEQDSILESALARGGPGTGATADNATADDVQELRKELRERIRDALAAGADPNVEGPRHHSPFEKAVDERNTFLGTLLDNGVRIKHSWEAEAIFRYLLNEERGEQYVMAGGEENWPIRLSVLQRLIAMLKPHLTAYEWSVVRHELAEEDERYPPEVAQAWFQAIGDV